MEEEYCEDDYFDNESDMSCDGCDGEGCPLCCGFVFSPGSEECEMCGYFNECAGF